MSCWWSIFSLRRMLSELSGGFQVLSGRRAMEGVRRDRLLVTWYYVSSISGFLSASALDDYHPAFRRFLFRVLLATGELLM